MVERSYHAYTERRRSPWAALLTALVVVAAAWLAGGLAAVVGWPLWARWLAAALVWPLVPFALLILISPRLGHRRVSLTIAIVGVGVVAALWRAALIDAATEHATWMLGDDDRDDREPPAPRTPTPTPEPTPESAPPPSPPSPPSPQPDDVAPPKPERVEPPQPDDVKPPADGVVPPPPATRCFRGVVETAHSDFAYGTTLADMDGDALVDAVWIHSGGDHQIKVWSGDRSGQFRPTSALDYDGGGLSVAVADFDRDDALDVATSDYEQATVTLWMGAGDGTLRRGDSFKTYRKPLAATTADLDGDGHSDLIVSHYFHVEVMRGSASAKLRTAPWLRLVKDPKDAKRLLTPEDIAAADLTGDGLLDLVIPKGDVTSVEVWTGKGRGRFRRSADVESCFASSRALVGDFYEDGDLDVVIGCPSHYELFVGDGDGGLERRGKIGPDNAYHHAGAADFNGDGHLDLLVPTIPGGIDGFDPRARGGRLVLLLGDGKGRFTEEDAIDLAGHQQRVVAVTDIDGDKRLDAVYECFGQRPGAHLGVVFGTGCEAPKAAP